MIVAVSARCEWLAAHGLPRAHCRPRGPRIRPGEPAPGNPHWGTPLGNPPPGTRPGIRHGNPARRRLAHRARPPRHVVQRAALAGTGDGVLGRPGGPGRPGRWRTG